MTFRKKSIVIGIDLTGHPGNSYLTQTLHYIGPIVNGEIIGEVPTMDFQYRTFAGCKGLKEIPESFFPVNFWEPFYGCSDLNPSLNKARAFHEHTKYCSGRFHGDLLHNCGGPRVLLDGAQEELFAKLTGYDLPQFSSLRDSSGGRHDRNGSYDAQCLAKVLNTVLQQGLPIKEATFVTGDVGIIEIKVITKTSEIPQVCWSKEIVTPNFVIACSCLGAISLTGDAEKFVGVFAENFVNDTMDAKILSVRPQAIHGSIEGPVTAVNSEVVFDGDCTIEAEDFPAIIAEGVVTLRGSGSIVLKGGKKQPVIGIKTNTGMSYGRWCPGIGKLNKIVIDNVHVKLESSVPNFTIGSYGTDLVPEIEFRNGGTLDCPEVKGRRIMVQSGAEGLYGSTKRSDPAIYEIEPLHGTRGSDSNEHAVPNSTEDALKAMSIF